jgi:hypothetical protein
VVGRRVRGAVWHRSRAAPRDRRPSASTRGPADRQAGVARRDHGGHIPLHRGRAGVALRFCIRRAGAPARGACGAQVVSGGGRAAGELYRAAAAAGGRARPGGLLRVLLQPLTAPCRPLQPLTSPHRRPATSTRTAPAATRRAQQRGRRERRLWAW